ncbi:MAG: type II toxin-antitoxin system Phd/YefM family antitoxin [Deferrisomatales bacterium]
MNAVVNVHEAKTHFSKLLARVEGGEEIVIGRAGTPVAKLVPVARERTARVPGSARGQVVMAPDFDAPLPDEVLAEFEG